MTGLIAEIGWLLRGVLILFLITNISACSKASEEYKKYKMKKEITEESKKRKHILLEKLEKGQKLKDFEISNLSAILLMESKYDEGINILKKLIASEQYKDEQYDLYFELSLFYIEKSRKYDERENKQQLIKKAEDLLTKGFENTPEKALAFYKRAKIYSYMGCVKKSMADLQESIVHATSKDLIFFEDGIYLKRDEFLRIVKEDLNRLKNLKDDCILK